MAKSSKFDRKGLRARWLGAHKAETQYNTQLQRLARHLGYIITGFDPDGTWQTAQPIVKWLNAYAAIIEPWATSVSSKMLADVDRRNQKAFREHGADIGRSLRHVIENTPIGDEFRTLRKQNVDLITSLPKKAAERVVKQVQEGLFAGTRSTTIAKEILATGKVTEARAKLIARTEVSTASQTLVRVRAQALGSEGYIWHGVLDGRERPEHVAMEGKFVRWDDPPSFPSEPTLGPYHAGCGPNCRCFATPVLPEY